MINELNQRIFIERVDNGWIVEVYQNNIQIAKQIHCNHHEVLVAIEPILESFTEEENEPPT